MRFVRLDLLAYGPFRGLSLDFSKPGLHVVFGRNEAGKSTTLRAITGLLYGIDTRTRDAHVHKPAELRIGGVLESRSGERVRVVRRKGNTNTLLDDQGTAIDEAILRRLTGGVTEETFRQAFGLDHDSLAGGAQALLEGKGDLGEGIFDASVGGGGEVQRLLAELEQQADAIWRPRGTTLPLNEALRAFTEAQKSVKERQSLPEAFIAQERALTEAKESRAEVARKRSELAGKRAELERARTRVPLEKRRERLAAKRAELGALVNQLPRVASLPERLAAYDRATTELRDRGAELDRLGYAVAEAARRAGIEVSAAPSLRLDARREGRLQKLLHDRTTLSDRIEATRRELARDQRELARLREATPAAPKGDDGAIASSLERARMLGDVEARLDTESARAKRQRDELEARATRIGRVSPMDLDAFVALEVPPAAAVERVGARASDVERRLARAGERLSDLDAEAASLERQIAEQTGDFAPPDANALRASREARDAAVRRLAEGDGASFGEVERAVLEADAIADRMIREADRVTTLARLRARLEVVVRQRTELTAEQASVKTERDALDAEHRALFAPSGISVRSFEEMRAWLDRHAQLVEAHARLRESEERVAEEQRTAEAARRELGAALGWPDARLSELVAEATRRLKAIADAARAAEETARAIAKLAPQVDERRASLDADTASLAVARASLEEILAPLGIPGDASTEEVTRSLEALRELLSLTDKRSESEARVRILDLEIAAFAAEAKALATDLAADLADLAPRVVASSLVSRADEARSVLRDLAAVEAQLAEQGDAPIKEEILAIAADPEASARAIEQADESLTELDRELSRLDHQLGSLHAGVSALRADSLAAESAATAQEALARVRDNAERWARAKLCAIVLSREIERYREENQGPLLTAASSLFSRLTLAAFSGIRAGFDDRDKPCLRCVRAGGTEVDVVGLSEGTRDQLYLSLRLASLLRRAEVADPMPLVLDDVLIQLDDQRAGAALAVLAEIACKMQVLFFTHHARLVDLARAHVSADHLVVHELQSVAQQELPLHA